jgi:hypothetical protein
MSYIQEENISVINKKCALPENQITMLKLFL